MATKCWTAPCTTPRATMATLPPTPPPPPSNLLSMSCPPSPGKGEWGSAQCGVSCWLFAPSMAALLAAEPLRGYWLAMALLLAWGRRRRSSSSSRWRASLAHTRRFWVPGQGQCALAAAGPLCVHVGLALAQAGMQVGEPQEEVFIGIATFPPSRRFLFLDVQYAVGQVV